MNKAGEQVGGAGMADGAEIQAEDVGNAGGVWSDLARNLDEGAVAAGHLRPAKRIHLTIPRNRLPVDIAAVLPVPKDRRSIFVVPWGDFVYLGTTDTDYHGPLDDPQCTPEDVAYILGAVNASVADPISKGGVVGPWAGLRPLVRDATRQRTADLSRRHEVSQSTTGAIPATVANF